MKKHISVPHEVQAIQLTESVIVTFIKSVKTGGISLFDHIIEVQTTVSDSLNENVKILIKLQDGRMFQVRTGDYLFFNNGHYAVLPRLIFESMYVLPEEAKDSETLGYDNFREVVDHLRKYKNLEGVVFRFFSSSSISVRSVELNVNGK